MATKAIKKNPVIQEETKTEEMEIISENETKTEINKDEQIEKLKEQVELLMKIADQNKIRQLAPQAVA